VAVGIGTALPGTSVLVYPNPSSGAQVHFEVVGLAVQETVEIELMDIQGKTVLRYEGPAAQAVHTLNRKDLAAGTYQYRVQAGDVQVASGKVVFR
jgi:hypothetical protein